MKQFFRFIKYRKIIVNLLRYSFEDAPNYSDLTDKEKSIIKEDKIFNQLKEL